MVLVILDLEVVDDRQRRPERDASLIGNCTLATVHAGRSESTTNVAAPQIYQTDEDDVPFQNLHLPTFNVTARQTKTWSMEESTVPNTVSDINSCKMSGLLPESCNPKNPKQTMKAWKVAKFALSVCLIAFAAPAEAAKLQQTNQTLAQSCQAWIEQKDCPIKERDDKDWEKLNSLCCSAYPGTVLHCQRQYDSNNYQFNIAACIDEKPTPKGHYVHLGTDKEGNPSLIFKACSDDSYEESERQSSYVTYNYCLPKKTACYGPGMTILCTGNQSSDNKCFCGARFAVAGGSAACARGWGKDDPCTCIPITCPDGQQLDCPLSEEQWHPPTCAGLDMAKFPTCKCVNPATNTTNPPTTPPQPTPTVEPPTTPPTTPTVVAPPTIKSDGSDPQFDVKEPDNGSSFIFAFIIVFVLIIIMMACATNPFVRFKLGFKQCPPVQWESTKL